MITVNYQQGNFRSLRILIYVKVEFKCSALAVCVVIATVKQRTGNGKISWLHNVEYNELIKSISHFPFLCLSISSVLN